MKENGEAMGEIYGPICKRELSSITIEHSDTGRLYMTFVYPGGNTLSEELDYDPTRGYRMVLEDCAMGSVKVYNGLVKQNGLPFTDPSH